MGTAAINEGNGSSLVLGATKKNGEREKYLGGEEVLFEMMDGIRAWHINWNYKANEETNAEILAEILKKQG